MCFDSNDTEPRFVTSFREERKRPGNNLSKTELSIVDEESGETMPTVKTSRRTVTRTQFNVKTPMRPNNLNATDRYRIAMNWQGDTLGTK
jgi:hypothetical protein